MTDVDVDRLAEAVAAKVAERLNDHDDRPLLTPRDLAARLGIAERTAKGLLYPVEKAQIRSFMVGGQRRVAPADVDRYVAAQRDGND